MAAAVVAGTPWLVGAAGVDVADTAGGVGTAAAGVTGAVAVAGAGAAAVAERTLAVTLPEPAELVVGPGSGAVVATCAPDTLGVAIPETGAVLPLLAAVVAAAGVVAFAGATVGCELMIPPVTAGPPFPPVAVVIVGASAIPFAPCPTVTVKGGVVAG